MKYFLCVALFLCITPGILSCCLKGLLKEKKCKTETTCGCDKKYELSSSCDPCEFGPTCGCTSKPAKLSCNYYEAPKKGCCCDRQIYHTQVPIENECDCKSKHPCYDHAYASQYPSYNYDYSSQYPSYNYYDYASQYPGYNYDTQNPCYNSYAPQNPSYGSYATQNPSYSSYAPQNPSYNYGSTTAQYPSCSQNIPNPSSVETRCVCTTQCQCTVVPQSYPDTCTGYGYTPQVSSGQCEYNSYY